MSARLEFKNDEQLPTVYQLDIIAAQILDGRRHHPEAVLTHNIPARDVAQAVALMRLALSVLDPTGERDD